MPARKKEAAEPPKGRQFSIYLSERQADEIERLLVQDQAANPYAKRADIFREVVEAGLQKLSKTYARSA